MNLARSLRLDFLPGSTAAGLLVLRLWFGLSVLFLHGWSKVTGFSDMSGQFMDPIGIGSGPSLVLAILAEVICAILIVIGLFTRLAALLIAISMTVAFTMVHGCALSGPGSGELAFLFLGAAVAILLAGPGRFSLDAKSGSRA